jgi:hypothetical protein
VVQAVVVMAGVVDQEQAVLVHQDKAMQAVQEQLMQEAVEVVAPVQME